MSLGPLPYMDTPQRIHEPPGLHCNPIYTWTYERHWSWTDFETQAHDHLHDHHAVCLEIHGKLAASHGLHAPARPVKLQALQTAEDASSLLQVAVNTMTPISWNLDVHQHAHELTRRFEDGVRQVILARAPFHRKPHFQRDTILMIREKARLRGVFLRRQRTLRLHPLRICFQAWSRAGANDDWHWVADIDTYQSITWLQLFLSFRWARSQANALQRRDTCAFL